MKGVTILSHPLACHDLAIMRDRDTRMADFRAALERITSLLIHEATSQFEVRRIKVSTPLMETNGFELKRKVLLAPVLRAGLGMLAAAQRILPDAQVGFIGLKRNEATLEPETYCKKLPDDLRGFEVLLLDPMLATGGSSIEAIRLLSERGASRIRAVHLLAAPEGVRKVHRAFPSVLITVASLDRKLNDKGYILPGLGDAGDRLFGV